MSEQGWPERLWIVRHGESAGNVANRLASAAGSARIALAVRDADVPLSPTGRAQAEALGRSFADLSEEDRPALILVSPYRRARETASLIARSAGGAREIPVLADERFRERELGILDRLTPAGVRELHPEQAELRVFLGKFYFRPPGGESWCDVILRLRSALNTLGLHHAGGRVMIVCHQVVVLCLRYLLENLDEERILAIDAEAVVANCSVTEYRRDPAGAPGTPMRLVRYNAILPLRQEGAPVTAEPPGAAAGAEAR